MVPSRPDKLDIRDFQRHDSDRHNCPR
jgi:hypothetical protein